MLIKSLKIILVIFVIVSGLNDSAWATAAKNPLIIAPMISPITVDGNLSDWSDSSDWADFGAWYNGGLASDSRAIYAWNDSADRLYIGVESNESIDLYLEVGGLMGNLSNPDAVPGSAQTTQIQFKYNSGTNSIDILNQFGQISTGIVAAYKWNGTKMTIEISTPIYSDWDNSTSAMALSENMDIYVYANVASSSWAAGDSQVANGTYIPLSISKVKDVASQILFGNLTTCGDLGTQYLKADLNQDCYVTFADFALLAEDWMACTDPGNPVDCE
ncbi:MAG: hypothetical protein A2Y12_17300 [Planctomycetes bacterium GWF2_42_9]|nr:MAG: hypothetical protein A2Y12_17300 [Planctomycetes bacterium GWF2_42_9]